jgi:hypothetical protein
VNEVLIVLSTAGQLTARDLAVQEPISLAGPQLFGDRVLIAHLAPSDYEVVSAIDGVSGVFQGPVPMDLEPPDDPAAKLAIDAWNSRKNASAVAKERIGDGVAWDDPRFEREGSQDQPGEDG